MRLWQPFLPNESGAAVINKISQEIHVFFYVILPQIAPSQNRVIPYKSHVTSG